MSSMPTVTFAPGGRAACVKGRMWLFVDCALTHPMVLEAWAAIDGGGSADEVVGAILSHGMSSAPDFVLASSSRDAEGSVRFVVRGSTGVQGVASGQEFARMAYGILSDVTVEGVEWFTLQVTGAESVEATLPVVAGILPVDTLKVVVGAPAAVAASEGDAAQPEQLVAPAATTPVPAVVPDVGAAEDPAAEDPAAEDHAGEPAEEPAAMSEEPAEEPAEESAVALSEETAQADAEDPEVLASIREYERLFGAPDAPESADPAESAEPADATIGTTDETLPETPEETASQESESASVSPAYAVPVEVSSPAVVPAPPAPAEGGFIEVLPDFFGPLVGAPVTTEAASPAPSTPHTSPPITSAPITPTDIGEAPIAPAPATPAPVASQGRTVNRAHLPSAVREGPTVWAARCPVGHPSQAFAANCRVCGQPIPAQEPQEIPRPVLGRLVIDGVPPITIDSDLVMGRDPHPTSGGNGPAPRLVVLNDPRMEVSSLHASITLNFWDVCLTDLGSTNGTEIVMPDGRRQRLAQHTPVTIQPGTKIVLAEVLELTFEATG